MRQSSTLSKAIRRSTPCHDLMEPIAIQLREQSLRAPGQPPPRTTRSRANRGFRLARWRRTIGAWCDSSGRRRPKPIRRSGRHGWRLLFAGSKTGGDQRYSSTPATMSSPRSHAGSFTPRFELGFRSSNLSRRHRQSRCRACSTSSVLTSCVTVLLRRGDGEVAFYSRTMPSVRLRSTLLAMSLVAAACGGAERVDSATPSAEQPSTESTTTSDSVAAPSTTSEMTTSSSTTSSSTTTSPGETTSAVTAELVPLVGGGQLDLNSIEGQDTVLWFWAPW